MIDERLCGNTDRLLLGDTDTGTDYDHSTDYIGVFTGHGDSSYHGHGTVCRDKNTEEGGTVLHMGDPRDPSLVQLFVVFYGLPNIGILIEPFPAAVLVFSINEGASGCRREDRSADG